MRGSLGGIKSYWVGCNTFINLLPLASLKEVINNVLQNMWRKNTNWKPNKIICENAPAGYW